MTDQTVAPTLGLRHVVLWVSDPHASARFYAQALGLEIKGGDGPVVFLSSPGSTTDHDLGLFQAADANPPAPRQLGMYHVAWEVATLDELEAAKARLAEMGALVGENNHGVSRSLYCQDPDGLEFEIMWEVPVELLHADEPENIPLDFVADKARFGADTLGNGAR